MLKAWQWDAEQVKLCSSFINGQGKSFQLLDFNAKWNFKGTFEIFSNNLRLNAFDIFSLSGKRKKYIYIFNVLTD